jgi:proteasome accessory factor B
VSRTRTERLVNLVICLLSTRRFLSAAQIAATVPGYEHDPEDPRDHEAFQRKFERDKAELRELGVPLEIGTASVFDTEVGYRIARPEYALPDIRLAPDEAAAVGIAARLWQQTGLAAAASSGLAKLRAAGIDVDPHATLGVEPVMTLDPAFEPLTSAVRHRQAVTFDYHTPDADAAATRRLQPWGVVCWRGRWYVVGHDLDREATRCFRLSRIVTDVQRTGRRGAYTPPQVDLIDSVARWSGPVERPGRATVMLRPGRGAGVRRWAEQVIAGDGRSASGGSASGGLAGQSGIAGPDGDRVVLRYADAEFIADWLVAYGADVMVLDPPEVRELVLARLAAIAAAHPVLDQPRLAEAVPA